MMYHDTFQSSWRSLPNVLQMEVMQMLFQLNNGIHFNTFKKL